MSRFSAANFKCCSRSTPTNLLVLLFSITSVLPPRVYRPDVTKGFLIMVMVGVYMPFFTSLATVFFGGKSPVVFERLWLTILVGLSTSTFLGDRDGGSFCADDAVDSRPSKLLVDGAGTEAFPAADKDGGSFAADEVVDSTLLLLLADLADDNDTSGSLLPAEREREGGSFPDSAVEDSGDARFNSSGGEGGGGEAKAGNSPSSSCDVLRTALSSGGGGDSEEYFLVMAANLGGS